MSARPVKSIRCRLGLALAAAWVCVWIARPADAVEFPQNPQQWLNSPPWTVKQAAGKLVFLYFFNELDPECQMRWKEMNELSKEYEDKPVLFIAVNAGGKREAIQEYVQQSKVSWPVLLDTDKSFAKKFPITTVTRDNGMQVALINPDGSIAPGAWDQPEDSMKDGLKYAKFNIDPKSIPAQLRSTWLLVEYQNYAAASKDIKKGLKSPKEEIKAGAEALLEAIKPMIEEKSAVADTAYDAGEKWPAYKGYAELAEQFKGYDLPANAESRKKELQADPAVKGELAAMKTFEAAKKQTANPAQKKKGIATLKKLIKDKPDTDAAKQAEVLVTELES